MMLFERRSTNYIGARGRIEAVPYICHILIFCICQTKNFSNQNETMIYIDILFFALHRLLISSFIYRKIITIEIIDRDQYQRNETFIIRLGEPTLIKDENEDDSKGK